jgi:hypothetical protein
MAKPKADSKPVVDSRGRMVVHLGGATYVLRPSYEAQEAIETLLDRSINQLAAQAYAGALKLTDLAIIVVEFMKAHGRAEQSAGPSYTGARAEKIARLIMEEGAPAITARIAVLLTLAITGGYTAEGEPKAAMR